MKALKIQRVRLSPRHPQIVVCFDDRASAAAIRKARKQGVQLVELRIDLFRSSNAAYVIKQIQRFKAFSILATIRSKKEGGKWKASDAKRLALYQAILPYVGAFDIEASSKSIVKKILALPKPVVVSYHNFHKTPPTAFLTSLLRNAKASGAGAVKIATFAKNEADVERMAKLTQKFVLTPLITLCMGPSGRRSRVDFPLLGSLLTYAHSGRPTAPGQMNFEQTYHALLEKRTSYGRIFLSPFKRVR